MPMAPPPPKPGPVSVLLRLLLGLFALAVPLFALWLATALVASAGLPVIAALLAGLVVVIGLPIAWDFWSEARWRRKQPPPARILSRADRLRLRIFTVGFVFSAGALLIASRASVGALATHGTWFMGSAEGNFANGVRDATRGIARSLAGALGVDMPYDPGPVATPTPTPVPADIGGSTPTRPATPPPRPGAHPTPDDGSVPAIAWPLPAEPHPAIMRLTDSQASDIDAVAAYIKARETDTVQRVKAIHDFVVRQLAYDTATLVQGASVPSQEAADVFVSRKATCDGYAKLMVAIGQRTGDEMVEIVGRSRGVGSQLDGFYHAWVGVKIGGRWYLVDPTWDAGSVFGDEWHARYSTSYLFTPASIFAYDHLPDEAQWSLLDPPLTQAAFVARPALSAHFAALGLRLNGIDSSSVEANGQVTFSISNPKKVWVNVLALPKQTEGTTFSCVVPSQADPVEVACTFGKPGTWELELYANNVADGAYQSIGFIQVKSR
ncbi:MAG: transglutaminase domain-containing protein [Myxococcota bacterium]